MPGQQCSGTRCQCRHIWQPGQGKRTKVMKNWLPFVSGPALAMLRTPALSCFMVNPSSLKVRPYMDSPPVPGITKQLTLFTSPQRLNKPGALLIQAGIVVT